MNWIVISIGTALVLALFTALIGPFFIDWTAYRSTIEANAERLLGTHVTIGGEAELRLLPNPRIRLTDVRLGDADAPIMTARAVELDIELTPLLRRELHVSELRLAEPVATVTIEKDGTLAVPDFASDGGLASFFDVESVGVANIGVSDGELRVRDRRSGADTALTDIALIGEARSLRGPFSASGTLRMGGVEQRVDIGGGRLESGTIPVSLRLLPEGSDLSLGFEGAVVPRRDALAMRGNLTVTATGRPAWSLRGDLRVSSDAVTLSRGTVRYGAGAAAIELTAEGRYGIAESEPLTLALAARQLDLDRLDRALRAEAAAVDAPGLAGAARPPQLWLDALAAHLAPALAALGERGGVNVPVEAELDVGTVVAGGSLIRDVSAAFGVRDGAVSLERAEALLPGDTTVDLTGRISENFVGRVSVSASQPAVLGRWWTGATVTGGTMDPVFLAADIEAGANGVSARRLSVRIGQSSASGQAVYDAGGSGPAQLDVALTAGRLALSDLADAAAVLGAAGWRPAQMPDVRIDLAADEVLFGGTAGASLSLDADFRDGMLTIDALSAQDIAGAQLFASGSIGDLFGSPVGAIEGTLTIDDGARLGAALDGLDTGYAALARLAAVAPALAPADARFRLSGGAGADAQGLALTVDGTAAGTTLALDAALMPGAAWKTKPARLEFSARNPDAARLLAQLGFDISGEQAAGSLDLAFAGVPADGMDGTGQFDLLGLAGRFAGDLRLADGLAPAGTLSLDAQSLGPLAKALALDLPDLAPLQLTSHIEDGPDGLKLDAIAGTAAGVGLTGALHEEETGLAGQLAVDALDFGPVAALLLGSDPLASGEDGRSFANTAFPVPLADLFPPVTLELETEALNFGSVDLGKARMGLSLGPDRLAVSGLEAEWGEGTLSGDLALTREGPRAALSGTLSIEDAALATLGWEEDGAPVATGRFSASGTFEGAGFTPSGLVVGLGGEGRFTLGNVRVAALNPAPLDLGTGAFADEVAPTDEAVRTDFAAHLAGGDLAFAHAEGTLALAGGTLRLNDTALPTPGETTFRLSGALDLITHALEAAINMVFVPEGAQEAVPVTLTFDGPAAAPQRHIDVATLAAFLNLRRLEQQVKAVEEQNQALEAEANRYAPPALPLDAPTDEAAPDAETTPDAPGQPTGDIPVPIPSPTDTASDPDEDARLGAPADAIQARLGRRPSVRDDLLRRRGVDPAALGRSFQPQPAFSPTP